MGFRIDLGGTIDDAQTTLPWSSALFVATRDAAYAKACWITSISSISGGFLKLDPQVTIVFNTAWMIWVTHHNFRNLRMKFHDI